MPESDHDSSDEAARRTAAENGSDPAAWATMS
jgi:hypothetical protein